ncbi:hypothetical protein [Aeromicrobium sp. IC_218]|uniref:hypothetical protein n=1 Tax=Aeromicrobium sp. IC_218 TaxID=2545468 RepID=UPI001038F88A|nr:hypothetical protein [Aeromicrobium sp. IC_218]TCI96467.1 hypothetical protein E0W78_14390 [Aeromicrobium sp. IC_218]
MRTKRLLAAVATLGMLTATAACDGGSAETADPEATASTASLSDQVGDHESGPDSPIGYGMRVPRGATQLGPLVRYRSDALVAAYQADLDAAVAQKKAEDEAALQEELEDGETPPTPTPTPTNRPSDDTYDLLEEQPSPDVTISAMRIDGEPSDVVHRMLGQIAAVLPDNEIDPANLAAYCPVQAGRYTGCHLAERGLTGGGRDVSITLDVAVGSLQTRTGFPASDGDPVMVLQIAYAGDPREGQEGKETEGIDDMPDPDATAPVTEAVWPRMDLAAPADSPLLGGTWTLPEDATLLLTSDRPSFVMVQLPQFADADELARSWASGAGEPVTNTIEELNEITTTYTGRTIDGSRAFGAYVATGRGAYAFLMRQAAPAQR